MAFPRQCRAKTPSEGSASTLPSYVDMIHWYSTVYLSSRFNTRYCVFTFLCSVSKKRKTHTRYTLARVHSGTSRNRKIERRGALVAASYSGKCSTLVTFTTAFSINNAVCSCSDTSPLNIPCSGTVAIKDRPYRPPPPAPPFTRNM